MNIGKLETLYPTLLFEMTSPGKWFDEISAKISESIRDILRGFILTNLEDAFSIFNDKVSDFTTSLIHTPESFNSSVYNLIKGVSESIMVPIGIIILAFVFVIELYDYVKEMNNSMSSTSAMSGKLIEIILKTMVFMIMITHAWEITMYIFEIGADAVDKLSKQTPTVDFGLDIESQILAMEDMSKLLGACLTSVIVGQGMKVANIALILCMYIRFFEIYIYCSAAPATYATLLNKDWGEIGKNYIRNLVALAMQAFFMLLMLAIYGAVIANLQVTGDLNTALWECLGYCVMLILMLFRAGSLSKSIFNAH